MLKETTDLVRDGVPNIFLFYLLSIFFLQKLKLNTLCWSGQNPDLKCGLTFDSESENDRVFIRLIMIKIFVGCR